MSVKFSEIEYKRPDLDSVIGEMNDLVSKFKEAGSFDEQDALMKQIDDVKQEFNTYEQIAGIRHSINTLDKTYETEKEFYDENLPLYHDANFKYYSALSDSKFRDQIERKYGKQLLNIADFEKDSFSSEIIDLLKEENKLSSEYTKLQAKAEIEFEGKTVNLAGLSPFEQDPDRDRRKRAVDAKFGYFEENSEQFDEIFDKLVKVRTKIAHKLGFKSFVELGYKRMLRSDYDQEMAAYYRDQIAEHVVPVANMLRENQRKRLGLETLMYYDLNYFFKTGNPTPKGDPDWIIENGKKMYSELSPETKEFFDFMVDNQMMDLVNKKGKAGGGYCTLISKYKAPFIFSNFNGTSHDIDVLTHEAGHAFQVYSSLDIEPSDYYWPTYEACEIHSMSMEFFTWPWMNLFFKGDTEKYKYNHLASSILFLPYGASVDEFQHVIYNNPEMTPAERKAAWREIEKKYSPYLDYGDNQFLESGGMWQKQSHIYQMPFYYIDYTLAQICAFQFWTKLNSNFREAWADYLTLCKAGGSKPFLELVELAGLKSPFAEGTVKNVVEGIASWLDKVDDSQF